MPPPPAQKRLLEALKAPVASTIKGEHARRNNAILAVRPTVLFKKRLYSVPAETQRRQARVLSLKIQRP
ncbi:hypothetical protein ACJZ2D_016860 [Fusarium nematophilum]